MFTVELVGGAFDGSRYDTTLDRAHLPTKIVLKGVTYRLRDVGISEAIYEHMPEVRV